MTMPTCPTTLPPSPMRWVLPTSGSEVLWATPVDWDQQYRYDAADRLIEHTEDTEDTAP
ncbi:hypothetical protein FQS61_21860 [Halomonas sp. SBBP1]|nr:hypothetical protein [Halomonas sp. SBBP1]